MKGNIKTFALTSILQLLSTDRKTGVLQLRSEDNEVKIFFNDGTIVYALGSRKEGRLGHLLMSKDMISAQQLQEGLKLAKQRKQALGKVLVDKGYVSIKTLKEVLHKQIEDLLLELFYWDQGEFEYEDKPVNLKAMVVTEINIMSLILEASRRIDEMSVLKKYVKSDNAIFKLSAKAQSSKGDVKLKTDEWRVLALVDGKRKVKAILEASSLDRLSVYKILYTLLSYGYVEEVEVKQDFSSSEDQNLESVLTIYHETLQIVRKNLVAEIGPKAYPLFESSKPAGNKEQAELFKHYDVNNPPSTNIKTVIELLHKRKKYDFEEAMTMLVSGFDLYLANVLKETPVILDVSDVRDLIKEIGKILPYFKNYITDSLEPFGILEGIGTSLAKLENAVNLKDDMQNESRPGLFSLFRK